MGQAVLFNLFKDLELTQVIGHPISGKAITSNQRYANCALIFYVGYIGKNSLAVINGVTDLYTVATYPMSILTQRFPTAKVVAASIFVWSIIILLTPTVKSYQGLRANRFFLGVAESCLAPNFTVYITFWWTRQEQALRSGLWYGVVGIAMIVTPLPSWGLGYINGSFGQST
jgi:sugar phosphate permease